MKTSFRTSSIALLLLAGGLALSGLILGSSAALAVDLVTKPLTGTNGIFPAAMLDPARAATFDSNRVMNDASDNPDYAYLDTNNRTYGDCPACENRYAFGRFTDPLLSETLRSMNTIACFSGNGKRTVPFIVNGGNVSYDADLIGRSEICSGVILFVKGSRYSPMNRCMAFVTINGRNWKNPTWHDPSCLPDATPMNSNSGAVCACDASTAALICDGTPFNDSCGSPVCTGSMVCTPAANCGDPTHALGVNGQPLGGGCVCKPGFFNNPAAPPGSQCVPCPAGTYKSAASNATSCTPCDVTNGTYSGGSPGATDITGCGTVTCTSGNYLAALNACVPLCSTVSTEPVHPDSATAQSWCYANCASVPGGVNNCLYRITSCDNGGSPAISIWRNPTPCSPYP